MGVPEKVLLKNKNQLHFAAYVFESYISYTCVKLAKILVFSASRDAHMDQKKDPHLYDDDPLEYFISV